MSVSLNRPNPSAPVLDLQQQKTQPSHVVTARMIERMATELRARSGGELPHSFYVEKVKQRLRAKRGDGVPLSEVLGHPIASETPSVFHAWALRE